MHNLVKILVSLFVCYILCIQVAQSAALTSIVNVNLVDVKDGHVVPNQTVIIKDKRIINIGDMDQVSASAESQIIDGTDKYLIPGLWEMHGHTSSDDISRKIVLPLYVANGVTGVRSMIADCFDRDLDSCSALSDTIEVTNSWRADIAAAKLIGPKIIAGSAIVESPMPGNPSTLLNPSSA